ncbi:permease [Accumulibacter sp.]|uniref:permease n=1 Tax=Accumulibacter sp. TaxID=2053492 RepID=UPI0025FA9F16|nr:permease [Accumulibacter sp.]MCM8595230.1 permease [Accumulibacter sp.]MCM8626863.1 permease [Accumulibacter sp.]MDS4049376.1 permease [Accumulibacter sp.]
MDATISWTLRLLHGGTANLAAYLAAHVLLCLLPAFAIAGAMSALIPSGTVTRFLGPRSPGIVSYPAAAAAGSLLAVCSCTIVPLFAAIYRKGAGLGPAITFLFFAPAANILALVYTGGVIGVDLAAARLLLSLVFGFGIGLIMALLFQDQEVADPRGLDDAFAAGGTARIRRVALVFLLVWIALLIGGTLKLDLLTRSWLQFDWPWPDALSWQAELDHWVPHDASKGEEGLSLQGASLIVLLAAIAGSAWRGLENIQEGSNRWTWTSLALVALTLMLAALSVEAVPGGLRVGVTGRFACVAAALAVIAQLIARRLADDELRDWLWESWRFARQIFPLLVVGVFIVGMVRVVLRPEWIESLAGSNSLLGNLAGVAFGVFMYFPTLVEVPIARMFLDLGMHRGPLLAYLMSDPELSLQSILILSAIIGRRKTGAYVALVALFSTGAGMTYGAWIDGTSPLMLALSLAVSLALLAGLLTLASKRSAADKGV